MLVSALGPQGELLADRGFRLLVDGRPLSCRRWSSPPAGAVRLGQDVGDGCDQYSVPFSQQREQALILILLVQDAYEYRPYENELYQGIEVLLAELPPNSLVTIGHFGNRIPDGLKFAPPAEYRLERTEPDDEGEIRLLEALQSASQEIERAALKADQTIPARRVIAVVSDGRNTVSRPRAFADMGDKLQQRGIALFPIAFSLQKDKQALLGLAEMAARSRGTFRWAQSSQDLPARFYSLARELTRTQVVIVRGPDLGQELSRPGGTRTVNLSMECCPQSPDGELFSGCGLRTESVPILREPPRPRRTGLLLLFVGALSAAVFLLYRRLRRR